MGFANKDKNPGAAFPCNIGGTIELDSLWPVAIAWADANGADFSDVLDEMSDAVAGLEFCNEVCINHSSWVRCDFETRDWSEAVRRIATTRAAIESISGRWAI